jgi:hypothetical protein
MIPVATGIPWLGFVVYPTHRRIKVRNTMRHLGERLDAYMADEISFAEFDASIQSWMNHVRYADSWGLRKQVLRYQVTKSKKLN